MFCLISLSCRTLNSRALKQHQVSPLNVSWGGGADLTWLEYRFSLSWASPLRVGTSWSPRISLEVSLPSSRWYSRTAFLELPLPSSAVRSEADILITCSAACTETQSTPACNIRRWKRWHHSKAQQWTKTPKLYKTRRRGGGWLYISLGVLEPPPQCWVSPPQWWAEPPPSNDGRKIRDFNCNF